MEILLIVVLSLVGILALLLITALFVPRHYSVVVSETINRPRHTVLHYVSILQNQLQYSEWLRVDPNLQPIIIGEDGTKGAIQRWESQDKNLGIGEQEIKNITDSSIEVDLRLIKPVAGTCRLSHHFVSKEMGQTLYTCTFSAYAKYPINLPSWVLGRRFIKKAQQKTLGNVKRILENRD